MEAEISAKTTEKNSREKMITTIEIIGLTSVMIALSSFVAAVVIEIMRGTFCANTIVELVHNLSTWGFGLLTIWGLAITTLLSCVIFLALLLNKK